MNRKVSVSDMSYKEKLKYKTIIKIINGNIDKKKVSVIIGYSLRRINQLINIYKNEAKKMVLFINLKIRSLLIN